MSSIRTYQGNWNAHMATVFWWSIKSFSLASANATKSYEIIFLQFAQLSHKGLGLQIMLGIFIINWYSYIFSVYTFFTFGNLI